MTLPQKKPLEFFIEKNKISKKLLYLKNLLTNCVGYDNPDFNSWKGRKKPQIAYGMGFAAFLGHIKKLYGNANGKFFIQLLGKIEFTIQLRERIDSIKSGQSYGTGISCLVAKIIEVVDLHIP